MGFGVKWVRWIWWCISTIRYFVMVNGVPAGFFLSSRGPRLGDSLSPYLFVMGMDVLSILLRRSMVGGYVSSYVIRGRGEVDLNISYLLFC